MKGKGFAGWAVVLCAFCVPTAVVCAIDSVVTDATLTLRLHPQDAARGIRLEITDTSQVLSGEVDLAISAATPVAFVRKDGEMDFDNPLQTFETPVRVIVGGAQVEVSQFIWANDLSSAAAASMASQAPSSLPVLELKGYRVRGQGEVLAAAEAITMSRGLAAKLGHPELTGVSLGFAVLHAAPGDVRVGSGKQGALREETPNVQVTPSDGGVAAPGPDMTFCQLYGLAQFGRVGDVVGLAVATTSWNIGGRDMIWMQNPDPRHPMIVWNLYRLKADRFEHIGMSHVKHGFFALGDHQCDNGSGGCHYEPGHGAGDWLGQQCTDTYGASLNATQSGLGPRYEINPWTGGYTYPGSHLSSGHSHNGIQHRCQVRDADLVPAQNPGATYYVEGQYITTDDINPVNSISWKPVTVSGNAGGTFNFGMSGSGTLANVGPALNAWTGATQTVLAQQVPVVRPGSPDGRCILAVKTTDLGGGITHYEYALYNLDMHRKAKSFNIPLPPNTNVTNIGFSAVQHHDEPYQNTPWTSVVDSSGITWSTTNNPIRWGMMYNFRFDADIPPGDVTATVGLYEPGTPTSISGTTQGPFAANPAPEPQADPSGISKSRFISAMLPEANAAAGMPTAVRVTLTSLHHPEPPYNGGPAADFSSFEGEVRWVGPPTLYSESSSNPTTFHAAALQCEPFYQDWSTVGLLHITGREVVPSSIYMIQNVAVSCQGNEAGCPDVSAGLEVKTTRWCDLVVPYNPPSDTDQPDIGDISGLVDKFRSAPGAPIKVQALLVGDVPDLEGDVDFSQISIAVDAFQGAAYPFSGPASCP